MDQSGVLQWPFPVEPLLDQSEGPVERLSISECMDARARQVLAQADGQVAVQCASDIDSVAVAAALVKHAEAPGDVVVRYTTSSYKRYPEFYDTILPNLGVSLEDRTGNDLVGSSATPYCDGRCGDDFQAAYERSTLAGMRDIIEGGSVQDAIEAVALRGGSNPRSVALAEEGMRRWADAVPFHVDSPWAFFVALFRFCHTQHDSVLGIMMEPDTRGAFQARVPFFDSPVFTRASAEVACRGPVFTESEQALELRQYALDVFGDEAWFERERPIVTYYVYNSGRIKSHCLDASGEAHSYRSFFEVAIGAAFDWVS
ncbi:hypothetical protein [Vreelandella jeotgali]|uniref:hypothetical protein n=1 Tax=Vreelandella jeotgali TaxID=553386 RepID=UPI0012EA215B|nr:hypothetical protein [Halomonas jeotgali]